MPSSLYGIDLLGGNANRAVEWDACAGKQGREQISLIALDIGKKTSRFDGAPTFACDNEREVFALVLVAVFEPRTPHHDTVVEQGAFTFFQRAHLLDHVGVLVDVELVDGGHLANLFLIAALVCLRVVLIGEPKFRVRGPIGARSDIGAHPSGIGLEGEDGEIAHDLHVIASFVSLRDLHFNGR